MVKRVRKRKRQRSGREDPTTEVWLSGRKKAGMWKEQGKPRGEPVRTFD